MEGLIQFEELPVWVPGKVLLASDGQNWKNVALRSYRYHGQDVVVPAMRDFMLVSYKSGVTPCSADSTAAGRGRRSGPARPRS